MADATIIELPGHIALALSMASASTGTDYGYLLKTAQRESSFQVDARAATSSATGLFQFIEETWIRTIKDEGERYGLKEYADKISRAENGRYTIESPADRAAILALRKDPRISALMAGVYAQRNAEMIRAEIGRKPTSGELYIAHFLGPMDAARLIKLRDTQPALSAPDLFPKAAESNRGIFYALGHPLSVGAVYDRLISKRGAASPAAIVSGGGVTPEFGSWTPQVEREVTVTARGQTKPMLGGAASFSLFDAMFGAAKPDVPVTGWDATVELGDASVVLASAPVAVVLKAAKPLPKPLRISVKAPPSLIRGGLDTDPLAEGAAMLAAAETAAASSPRLKIIRVPAAD